MRKIKMGYDEKRQPDAARKNDPYRFDLDQNGLPVFTNKNLRFIWAMVDNNSAYNSIDETVVENVYKGMLNRDETRIKQAVYLTDKVNSTHLSVLGTNYTRAVKQGLIKSVADYFDTCECKVEDPGNPEKTITLGNGRLLTAQGIIKNIDRLVDLITADDESVQNKKNSQAVYEIARYSEDFVKHLGLNNFSKSNFSFATKICHHACVKGGKGDKYCIYDSVVGEVLPYYIWAYSTDSDLKNKTYAELKKMVLECAKNENPEDYGRFREYYDSVVDGITAWRKENQNTGLKDLGIDDDGKLGYRHVDRLIWYYFKGRRLVDARDKFKDLVE